MSAAISRMALLHTAGLASSEEKRLVGGRGGRTLGREQQNNPGGRRCQASGAGAEWQASQAGGTWAGLEGVGAACCALASVGQACVCVCVRAER